MELPNANHLAAFIRDGSLVFDPLFTIYPNGTMELTSISLVPREAMEAKMNERQKDAQAAEKILGWRRDTGEYPEFGWHIENGMDLLEVTPFFGTDHAAARLLEDEIERRGLWREYVDALSDICKLNNGLGHYAWANVDEDSAIALAFDLLRATPAQRRDAALKAVGVEG